ncbi:MAG: hypothetical protein ACHQ8D_05610 [Candidatus Rokuibacteriota bacterium]
MPDRDLKLNSLSRYAKASPRLVLEEHGHCEIPAGCGGVVLRWWNPDRAIPVTMWAYAPILLDMRLDGKRLNHAVPLVSFDSHILAFTITAASPADLFLMFAAVRGSSWSDLPTPDRDSREVVVVSTPDGSWRYSATAPTGSSWMESGFDDSDWRPMQVKAGWDPSDTGYRYPPKRMAQFSARALGVPDSSQAWVRKEFILAQTATVGPASPEATP